MGLIINQGIQDTTQDNKFKPVVAQNVTLEIVELKLAPTQANTLEVAFRILDGQYKNKHVFDRVPFDSTSPLSWRYRSLRECAGVPYKKDEPASIDIEKLLLHKAVKADLSIRTATNKEGEEQSYQKITYKVNKNKSAITTPTSTPVEAAPKNL